MAAFGLNMDSNAKPGRRPKWSLQTSFWFMLGIGAIVSAIVTLTLKKSIWVELEIVLACLSLCLFGFVFAVLYWGVVFDRNESLDVRWRGGEFGRWLDSVGDVGRLDLGGEDPLSCLLGLLLGLVLSVVLSFLIAAILWLGFGAMMTAVAVIALPLFFVFRRILRGAVVQGRRCRGRAGAAAASALAATAANMIWLYLVLIGGYAISRYFA